MSRLECYDAFVKATNDIGRQDKWIVDEDWAHHIRNEDGLKDCNVSHMNPSISGKCLFTNNQYVSTENKKPFFGTKRGLLLLSLVALRSLYISSTMYCNLLTVPFPQSLAIPSLGKQLGMIQIEAVSKLLNAAKKK